MTTRQHPIEGGTRDAAAIQASVDSATQENQGRSNSSRKTRQRSVYLFPAYGFTTALDIARRVEESGGGSPL